MHMDMTGHNALTQLHFFLWAYARCRKVESDG